MEPYVAKTKIACAITGVDVIRFNEAVASGFCEFAPAMGDAKSRYFDERDLITLRFYGALTRQKIHPRVAGRFCSELKAALPRPDENATLPDPNDAEFVNIVVDKFGGVGALPSENFKPEATPNLDYYFSVPVGRYRAEIRGELSKLRRVFD